jgi:hypothetical protein
VSQSGDCCGVRDADDETHAAEKAGMAIHGAETRAQTGAHGPCRRRGAESGLVLTAMLQPWGETCVRAENTGPAVEV